MPDASPTSDTTPTEAANVQALLRLGYELHADRTRSSGWRKSDGGAVMVEVPYEKALATVQRLQPIYHIRTTPTARVLTGERRDVETAPGEDYVLGETHMTVRAVADAIDASLRDVYQLITSGYLNSERFGLPNGGSKRLVVYDVQLHYLIDNRS